jgi:hypothetical protein
LTITALQKTCFYQENVDSSNITLSLNGTYIDQSNGVAITLDWSASKDLYNFAGFKIFYNPSLSHQKFHPVINNCIKEKAHESGFNYNILVKKLPDIARYLSSRYRSGQI